VVIRRQLKRRYVLAFFQKLPTCLVGTLPIGSRFRCFREFFRAGWPWRQVVILPTINTEHKIADEIVELLNQS